MCLVLIEPALGMGWSVAVRELGRGAIGGL
jgi:hypothetical protein